MGYRDFVLPDGTKVRTRISDKGTLEWYRDREELAERGYPDRPPDVDTETHRGWVEAGTANTRKKYENAGISSMALAHYVWSAPMAPEIKLMISWLVPGDAYYLRIKMESSGFLMPKGSTLLEAERYFAADQTEALNEFVEDNLREITEGLDSLVRQMGITPEWIVSPPGDAVEMDRLTKEAEADHKQEFADEWAEARRLSARAEDGETQAGSDEPAPSGEPDATVHHGVHHGRRLH